MDETERIEDVRARYPGSETFVFGDGPELNRQLLDLVRSGRKTATCMALRDVEDGKEAMPQIGRRDISLNWDETPALVIETVSIEIVSFRKVSESFALAEGENTTLAGWQRDHQDYFARNGGFDADMQVVCERFRVVEDFGR